jgi:spermidine synthase
MNNENNHTYLKAHGERLVTGGNPLSHDEYHSSMYETVSDDLVNDLLAQAANEGVEAEMMAFIVAIKEKYGGKTIKKGHLFWIQQNIDNRIPVKDVKSIPSFERN